MSEELLDAGKENVFFLILMYVFRLEGEVTEKEKEVLSNFLRLSTVAHEDDVLTEILSYRPPNLIEVLDYFKHLPSDETRFYYLLQVISLTAYDHISPRQEKIIRTIARDVKLGEEFIEIIEDIFLHRNQLSPHVLFIGNRAESDDIVKGKEDVSAFLIRYGDNTYLIAERSQGLIRLHQKLVYDNVVYRFDFADKLEIKGELINFSDLLFRFELKGDPSERTFSIVKKQNERYHEFLLTPVLQDNAIGTLTVKGSRIILKSHSADGKSIMSLDGEDVVGDEVIGCVDNKILIEGTFLFDLSQQVRALVMADAIGSKFNEKKKITIGNIEECDVFIHDDSGGESFLLLIEEDNNSEWILDLTRTHRRVAIDGKAIEEGKVQVPLTNGAIISVGPHNILFDLEHEKVSLIEHNIHHLKVEGLTVRFGSKKIGLHDISFENRARDFICILGPSGCGKTTLIRTLAGYHRGDSVDSILINSHPFSNHYDLFKNHIAYVSQENILFEKLTVWENMFAYGRIKAPHLSEEELRRRIDKVLSDVGLIDKRNDITGSDEEKILSGGEKKRLSIGMELIADVDVLFLDEPTSGLSSHDSLRLIQLLSHLSKMGKIIYVVIHQPSAELYAFFSHILLLDKGGYQAFFGKNRRLFEYFSKYTGTPLKTPDDVFEILEAVRRTPAGETVYEENARGQKIPARVKSPRQWAEEYQLRRGGFFSVMNIPSDRENRLPAPVTYGKGERQKQFESLFVRGFINKFRDRSSLYLSIGLPVALGIVISLVLRYHSPGIPYQYANNHHLPKFLFLSGIIFLFFAVSNSISEIYKDQIVLQKEKLIDYSKVDYLLSKLILLSGISLYQVILFAIPAFLVLGAPIAVFYDWHFSANLFVKFCIYSWIASVSMVSFCLYISSWLKSEKAAFLAVPLIIVPQIIFGGLFLKFNELSSLSLMNPNRPVPLVCDAIHSRWVYEGYLNLFRYEHPGKNPHFQTREFTATHGNYNNKEIATVFIEYNRSSERDTEVKEALDKTTETKFKHFVELIERIQNWEVSPSEMFQEEFRSSVNYFPYYKKILYPFVIPTIVYDTLILIAIGVLFFLITLTRLKVQHRVRARFNFFSWW